MAQKCPTCGKSVYFAEEAKAAGRSYHKRCLKCAQCGKALDPGSVNDRNDKIYCKICYSSVAGLKGFRGDGYAGSTLACVSGGAAGKVEYASGTIETESALSKGFTGYRMTSDAGVAGPTSAHTTTVMTEDTGKYLGAAQNSGQYRQAGDAGVTGALSAHSTTVMTEDTGKYSGASQTGGSYRQVGDSGSTGHLSAHSTTVMTEDAGKYVGTGDVSSGPKRFCPSCGTKAGGGRFCSGCGGQL